MEIGFSLGSNLGDRFKFLKTARDLLTNLENTKLIAQSSIYSTSPVDVKSEYKATSYYNCIIILESLISLNSWWKEICLIESFLGRKRSEEINIPRTIDIDLIYADSNIINSDDLIIPHPRWFKRKFVLKPLCEVRPDLVLPNNNYKVKSILKNLSSDEEIILIHKNW